MLTGLEHITFRKALGWEFCILLTVSNLKIAFVFYSETNDLRQVLSPF